MHDAEPTDERPSELPVEQGGNVPDPALPPIPADLAETFRLNTQILRYLHDSHARLVKVLERADRSEMVIQSSEALNKTFRRLQESQEELAQQLVQARKGRPRALFLAAISGAALVLLAAWWMVRSGAFDRDVARAADQPDVASVKQLADAVDRGFATNRVLQNENQAQRQELGALRTKVGELDAGQSAIAARADQLTADNQRLTRELDAAKEQLVAKDMAATELSKMIDARIAELRANAPAASAPASEPVAAASEPEALPPPKRTDPALETGIVGAMNRLLADSGVVDLRVLTADAIEGDALRAVTLEVRTGEGYPIGFHQAATCRIRRDAGGAATLVLESGESVRRGTRTPFPAGRLEIKIAALADAATHDPQIAALFAPPAASAPALSAAPIDAPATPLSTAPPTTSAEPPASAPAATNAPTAGKSLADPRAAMRLLNSELRADGFGAYEFFSIGGLASTDGTRLKDVEVHHYRGDGALQKKVVAKELQIAIDAARGTVTLVFRDGKHVTKGRDVPFFHAAGETVGAWALELDRADPARWNDLVQRLAALD